MQFYPHRTVEEQAERLPEELREAYKNSQIDRITIFDGDEELEVTGYAEYSYLDEKSYKTQPVRTQDGSIEEIEEYETFITPRLIIRYNMMGIEDYRSLMKMLKNRNGFMVKCFDIVRNEIVRNHMYVAPQSMPKIYQQYLMALGIMEHVIEFIGTNVISQKEEFDFSINEWSYRAKWGYTWKDWVNNYDYNTEGFSISIINDKETVISPDGTELNRAGGSVVLADDYIFRNSSYEYQ